ncbi:WS/DGAT/MGAT family O-acyltransferase [Tsukamurella soli]|uniref:Diacylglycerol O-acyltransferase n=1 Tax=Tsukamurella soli TaxID=644556 RepID=A0ABP8JS72_9ACTN
MERLSGLDASFLYLESRTQLMNVCGIIELDPSTVAGGYRFEALRDELARRVTAMPAFRRKLYETVVNVDHPVWVEDTEFDIEAHVHRVALPAPGGEKELADLCAHVAGLPLDRARPLWEMWVIEGLAVPGERSDGESSTGERSDGETGTGERSDGETGTGERSDGESETGRIGVMIRMHHAGVDGVTGAGLLAQLCSLTPEPPDLDEALVEKSTGSAPVLELAAEGVANVLKRPLSLVSLVPRTAAVPLRWIARSRRGEAMPAPFSAPRTPFNGTVGPHRAIAFDQIPLADVKRIKEHFAVKVNDVVLAACSGALREFLAGQDALPDQPLVAMIPVSVHGAEVDDSLVQGTNKVTGMFTRLATDVADPQGRLEAVRRRAATAKEHHGEIDANILRSWAQFAPAMLMSAAAKVYGERNLAELHPVLYNLVVSNVPGPDFPLYFLGAQIKSMYPLGPVFHGTGLNITVFSADGQLNVGVIADKKQVPDPWPLVRAFRREIDALLTAIPEQPLEQRAHDEVEADETADGDGADVADTASAQHAGGSDDH